VSAYHIRQVVFSLLGLVIGVFAASRTVGGYWYAVLPLIGVVFGLGLEAAALGAFGIKSGK